MIFSMTGYATASAELDSGSLTLELRAVNHRYLDVQLRMPDELRGFEGTRRAKWRGAESRPAATARRMEQGSAGYPAGCTLPERGRCAALERRAGNARRVG